MLAGVVFLNYQANEYKYWKIHDKGACQLQQEYDCNIQNTFLIMLNDNYTQRHILLLQTI